MPEITSSAVNPTTDPDKLMGFLNSIQSFNVDLIFSLNVGQKLYHYTNLDGLRCIIESSDLWLTNAQYCNDEEELKHGAALTTKTVVEEQGKAVDSKRREYLDELSKLLCGPELDPVYICCFCEKDDQLSQWRAYGANATGVTLEFEPGGFNYITGPDCPPTMGLMRFWKVFYPSATQERIVRNAVNYYPGIYPGATPAEWARWTAEAVRFFIPTFKNKDFEEEREWRLIFTPALGSPAKPSYRVARGMLIPYYGLNQIATQLGAASQRLPLTSVRIGPNPNKRLNAASVRMLLNRHGYDHVRVELSETPYRG